MDKDEVDIEIAKLGFKNTIDYDLENSPKID